MQKNEKMVPDNLEDRINMFRQQENLILLWPDYEIYDLLDHGIPLEELFYYTTIRANAQTFAAPLDSKEYNHMAIVRRLEIDSKLQKIQDAYIILTKRGLTVNKIDNIYIAGQSRVSIQVIILNNRDTFWGIQVKTADKVMILGPRYISGTGFLTFRCDFQTPVRSIVLYSVQRKVKYGIGPPLEAKLPKDAKRQLCIKFKPYTDYIQRDRSKNSVTVPQTQPQHLFKIGNAEYSMNQKERKQQKVVEGNNCIRIKFDRQNLNQPQQQQITLSIPLSQSQFQSNQPYENQLREYLAERLKTLTENVRKMNKQVEHTIYQDIQEGQGSRYAGLVTHYNELADIEEMDWNQQRQLLVRSFQKNAIPLLTFIYSKAVEQIKETIIERRHWLQLYQYSTSLHNKELKVTARKVLKIYLVLHADKLLKESEQDIATFNSLSKFSLKKCIAQALELHRHNCSTVSDLLFLLMKLEDKQNIFELYQSHQLSTELIIGESLNLWIQKHKLFHVIDSDFVYKQGHRFFNRQLYKPFSKSPPQPLPQQVEKQKNLTDNPFVLHGESRRAPPPLQPQETTPATITITRRNFTKNSFICSKKYQYGLNLYQVIVFCEQSSVMCLVEQSHDIFKPKHTPSLNSFEITINLTLNQYNFKHTLRWCFLPPCQPVGYSFPFTSQIYSMKCEVSLQRDIVHESIMSYLSIRLFELLSLPKSEQYTEANGSNIKLKKRTSSLFLQQNLQKQNDQAPMKETCFFHLSCQECQRFQSRPSIYRLNFADMYVLLKSAPFSNENHVVYSLFKYLTLNVVGYTNQSLLLSIVRWEYMNNLQLFFTLNSSEIQECMKKLLDYIVDKSVKAEGFSRLQNRKIAISTGRTYEQIWMHLQGSQFLDQFIKYKDKYKPK